jgi:hypothetical protein
MEMQADSGNFQAADSVQGDEQLSRQLMDGLSVDLGVRTNLPRRVGGPFQLERYVRNFSLSNLTLVG